MKTGRNFPAKVGTRVMRYTARTLSLLITLIILAMIIGDTAALIREDEGKAITAEMLFILLPFIFATVACGISWWREWTGGWLLLAAYIVLSLSPTFHSLFYHHGFRLYPFMWVFSLPYLLSSFMFLIISRPVRPSK